MKNVKDLSLMGNYHNFVSPIEFIIGISTFLFPWLQKHFRLEIYVTN